MARTTPGSHNYHRYAALLVMLQWMDGSAPPRALLSARRSVADVKPARARAPLAALFAALTARDTLNADVASAMGQCAAFHLYDGRYDIAAHLYQMEIELRQRTGTSAGLAMAYRHLSSCLLACGDVGGSWAACDAGLLVARDGGSEPDTIELLLAQATIYREERQLGEAERVLNLAREKAKVLGNSLLIARSTHELAVVIHEQVVQSGDVARFDTVCALLADAAQASDQLPWRFRLLNDAGRTLCALGLYVDAAKAHELVYAQRHEQDVRWVAALNLMDLAIAIGDDVQFTRWRRALAQAKQQGLPDILQAEFHALVAEGCFRFGRVIEARRALARAASVAKRIGRVTVLGTVAALEEGRTLPRPALLDESRRYEMTRAVRQLVADHAAQAPLRPGRRSGARW